MDKQHAHEMLEQLDPSHLDAVVRFLEVLTESVTTLRDAPIDDEPLDEEEERAVADSKEWFMQNRGIPFEEVVAGLGFAIEEIVGNKESA